MSGMISYLRDYFENIEFVIIHLSKAPSGNTLLFFSHLNNCDYMMREDIERKQRFWANIAQKIKIVYLS